MHNVTRYLRDSVSNLIAYISRQLAEQAQRAYQRVGHSGRTQYQNGFSIQNALPLYANYGLEAYGKR